MMQRTYKDTISKINIEKQKHFIAIALSHIIDAPSHKYKVYIATIFKEFDQKQAFIDIRQKSKRLKATIPGMIVCRDYAGSRHHTDDTQDMDHFHIILLFRDEQNCDELIKYTHLRLKDAGATYWKPHNTQYSIEAITRYSCKTDGHMRPNGDIIDALIYPFCIQLKSKKKKYDQILNNIQHYMTALTNENFKEEPQ